MKRLFLIIFLSIPVSAIYAADPVMRCRSKLIQSGMASDEVKKHCGAPDQQSTEERPVFSGNRRTGTYTVELWQYDRGRGQSPAVLEVEAGQVKKITFVN